MSFVCKKKKYLLSLFADQPENYHYYLLVKYLSPSDRKQRIERIERLYLGTNKYSARILCTKWFYLEQVHVCFRGKTILMGKSYKLWSSAHLTALLHINLFVLEIMPPTEMILIMRSGQTKILKTINV